ncbi:MAG: DUF58 domain-containing protein [Clostridiaceae bacterium]
MNVTRRFIILVFAGSLLLVPAAILHNSLTVFIIYNLVCFALLIIDYSISDADSDISIERSGNERLSLFEREPISFEVYNKSSNRLYIELRDEVPDFHFRIENGLMNGFIEPHKKACFNYFVIPSKRGAFTFPNIYASYLSKLKLSKRMIKINLSGEFKVYPDLKNLRKYRLGICNNRLYKQGRRSLKMLGKGSSYESLREYVHGDEFRKINWKATARAGRPFINQYEPEKNQHVHILIDTGRAMSLTVKGWRKLDLVINTALILCDIVNQNGDKSALMLFNTKVNNMILPGKGPGHRNQILEALYHIEHTNDTSNYDEAFNYLKRKERHRSIVFLFTDFETVEEAGDLMRVLPVISRNNLVVLPLIRNENLHELSIMRVKNREDLFNKGVALELHEDRCDIINHLNRRGVFCLECPAEKLELSTINKYIQVKNQTYI